MGQGRHVGLPLRMRGRGQFLLPVLEVLVGGCVGVEAAAVGDTLVAGEEDFFVLGFGDFGGFGVLAFVGGGREPVFQGGTHFGEGAGVCGDGGEVVYLVGVGLEVVEFFGWFMGGHKAGLGAGEFALFVEDFHQAEDWVEVLLVEVWLGIWAVRVEVADVFEFFGADATDAVGGFVASVAGCDDVGALFCVGAEEDVALHMRWDFEAGEGE